jgi:hypothetical protein
VVVVVVVGVATLVVFPVSLKKAHGFVLTSRSSDHILPL